jgi:hypothetical protein
LHIQVMADERFDQLFLSIAQQSQGIEPLLDSLFSFLRRRTDFFVGASPSQVEELVLKLVRKQAALSEQTQAEKRLEKEREEKKRKERLEKKRKVRPHNEHAVVTSKSASCS